MTKASARKVFSSSTRTTTKTTVSTTSRKVSFGSAGVGLPFALLLGDWPGSLPAPRPPRGLEVMLSSGMEYLDLKHYFRLRVREREQRVVNAATGSVPSPARALP